MRLAQVAVQPQLAKLSKYEVSEGMFIFFGHSQRGKVKSLTICLAAVGHQACSFVEWFCQVMLKPFLEKHV